MTLPAQVKFSIHLAGFVVSSAILFTGLPGTALAQTPATQNLLHLFETAKLNDPTYLAAASQLQADLEIKNQARAALLPQVNLGARIEKQENTYSASRGSVKADRNPGTYSLVLNQALFRPQAWEDYKQSQLVQELAKLRFQQTEQDLMLRLSRAYFDLLAAQDELASLTELKKAITEQLAFAKASFEVGNATITDQQEAQARFDLLIAQELAAKNQLALRRLQLEAIVLVPVGKLARLQPASSLNTPEPNTPEKWLDQARKASIPVQRAQLAQLIARSESKKANYGHLPTLDFSAQVVKTEQQIFDGNTGQPFDLGIDNSSIGVNLSIPLFSGGATQSKVRQQAALLEKSRQDSELAGRTASQLAKGAFLGVQTSLAQVKALETAVASSGLALKANKTAYEVGIRVNLDVLNAQQQLNATQRDLLKAKYSSLVNMLELQATTGQLDVAAIEQINKLLE